MKSLRKIILKNFIGGLVFCFTIMLFYFAVKAWSGLTVSPGDKLLASKRNELIGNVTTLQTKVDSLSGVQTSLPQARSADRTGYVSADNAVHLIPGLTKTINLVKDANVYISVNGEARMTVSGIGIVIVYVYIDGVNSSEFSRVFVSNDYTHWFGRSTLGTKALSAGNHTIEVKAKSYKDSYRVGAYNVCAEYNGSLGEGSNCTLNIQAFYK